MLPGTCLLCWLISRIFFTESLSEIFPVAFLQTYSGHFDLFYFKTNYHFTNFKGIPCSCGEHLFTMNILKDHPMVNQFSFITKLVFIFYKINLDKKMSILPYSGRALKGSILGGVAFSAPPPSDLENQTSERQAANGVR